MVQWKLPDHLGYFHNRTNNDEPLFLKSTVIVNILEGLNYHPESIKGPLCARDMFISSISFSRDDTWIPAC